MRQTLRFASGFAALFALAASLPAVTPPGTPRTERPELSQLAVPTHVSLITQAHTRTGLQPVKLRFTVTAAGEPRGIEVVSSSRQIPVDCECVVALKQMHFAPKTVDGVAVAREETLVMLPKIES